MNSIAETPYMKVIRKMGAATFAFFLIKGLLWLVAPFVFYLAI